MTPCTNADPGALWLDAVRHGDFAAAWLISDRVLEERRAAGPYWHLPRHEQWLWDGRPPAGRRVLVHCYHGLGDTIQFARFLPALSQLAREVLVWAQPSLVSLLRTLPGVGQVLPLHDGSPEVQRDADVEVMELAHLLRVTQAELPTLVPYFVAPSAQRLSARFSVGVGLTSGQWDPRRSVPTEALGNLDDGKDWFSLQLESPIAGMRDVSTPDIVALAGRLMSLDLVITVDTMLAHLAGALGVPTWTLLPHDADWRWQTDRDDSPWYPTMRLFRQPCAGNWSSVLDGVRRELRCVR